MFNFVWCCTVERTIDYCARIAGLLAIAVLGALAVTLFSYSLTDQLASQTFSHEIKDMLLSQANKMGGIEILPTLSSAIKTSINDIIQQAFLFSYRWVLGLCAMLSALGAVLALGINIPEAND